MIVPPDIAAAPAARSATACRAWLVLLLAMALPAAAAKPQAWQGKVDARVLQNAAAGESEFLVFLSEQADVRDAAALKSKPVKGAFVVRRLRDVAHRTQAPILKWLRGRRLAHRPFWLVNMIWVRGDRADIETLSRRSDVLHILANPAMKLQEPPTTPSTTSGAIEWNIARVRAPEVWALGFTGQGVVIGGQDTGYQWDHPALISRYRGWNGDRADHNYNWHDAIHTNNSHLGTENPSGYDTRVPLDDDSHGTHTMGTMIGDDGTNQIGMAPGAKWIGCRNMDRGWGTPATYTECFEWFIAPTDLNNQNPDPSRAPDVINNSWTCPPEEGAVDPLILQTIVERVRAAGIVVVASAGNYGAGAGTIRDPPAIYDASFTVGATDSGDGIASFSSRGPVTIDGSFRMKPDISGPGVGVRSSVPGGYAVKSGTSMAGPHVAGLVALLLSAHPELKGQVDVIETIIEQSAVPLGDPVPNNTFGWGRIDALAALGLDDSDRDGLTDYQEYLAGTDPHDAASGLRITGMQLSGTNVVSLFTTVVGRKYTFECVDTLSTTSWNPIASNMVGTGSLFQVNDPGGASSSQRFYRVKVQTP
jgi:subtilisin family serine protease